MRLRNIVLAVAGCLLAAPAFPQGTPTATISGHVTDSQGAVLPGVTVVVESPNLQGKRSTVSSANGDYILPLLPPGEYTITFQLTGFNTRKQSFRLASDEAKPLDVSLAISPVSETITVVGTASGDFTQTAPVSTSFKAELLDRLPTARTTLSALALSPNAQATGPSGAFTIAGGLAYENLYVIDGAVAMDNIRNTPFALFIEDAIQESTVTSGNVSAEYGRFGGGVSSTITKSGGNDFSGSFRYTGDNNSWAALTPFPNDFRVDKFVPTYEATLGGPVMKDKVWFFGAYRGRDVPQAQTTNAATAVQYKNEVNEKRYEGKLTVSPVTNHTFKGTYFHISSDEQGNVFPSAAGVLDLASLVHRQLPQNFYAANYTGILSPKVFVEAQYSKREFTFQNSGATSTDLIGGTLLIDRARGNLRYHAPTFCGVCDPEKRDNWDIFGKVSYFLSTSNAGSHQFVAGFDAFNDQRTANNHQSGSDYRILGTTSIIQGTNVYPVFNNDGSTLIRWTPIFVSSQGTNFKTYSGFVNDTWRINGQVSVNLGLRYDKNNGANSLGAVTVRDSTFSPRLSITVDPVGDGKWAINAAYAKYVAGLANSIGDSSSPGGQPATIDFVYQGPPINVGNPANPVDQNTALQQLFAWFNGNGGTTRPRATNIIPGVTSTIAGTLATPNRREFSLGVSRRLGSRGLVRLDGIYRKGYDFYADRIDTTTGQVVSNGVPADFDITQNLTDPLERTYKGITAQLSYRVGEHLNLAGNYTLSETYGNFEGENGPSGPLTSGIIQYPEYKQASWAIPLGDLNTDVRHRVRAWAIYDVPWAANLGSLTISALESFNTGTPYGASGLINDRPFVTNPGYVTPPNTVAYFFTARDAFRTANTYRTDLALNYSHKLGYKRAEIFGRGLVQNVFNRLDVVNFQAAADLSGSGCGSSGCINTPVLTSNNTSALQNFNPFTTQPIQGVNWNLGPTFGTPSSRFAYGTPRVYQFSVGIRF